jgi:hypothetical protein
MTSNSIIVTIPHTGTRFLQERLGIKQYVHTVINWPILCRRIENKKIISPLRPPIKVWKSWARRRNPKNEAFPYIEFTSAWYTMHALDLMYEVDFIDLEAKNDPRISDWTPIGNEDYGPYELPEINLNPIYKLPFVTRFYDKPE